MNVNCSNPDCGFNWNILDFNNDQMKRNKYLSYVKYILSSWVELKKEKKLFKNDHKSTGSKENEEKNANAGNVTLSELCLHRDWGNILPKVKKTFRNSYLRRKLIFRLCKQENTRNTQSNKFSSKASCDISMKTGTMGKATGDHRSRNRFLIQRPSGQQREVEQAKESFNN